MKTRQGIETKPLGAILQFQRGFDLPNQRRITGEFPVISSSGITGNHHEYKCDGSNVITGRYGTIGEVYFYEGKCWPLNTTLFVKDFLGNEPKYIYYLLQHVLKIDGKDKSTVPGVDRNVLHQMEVPYHPDVNSQNKITHAMELVDGLITTNQKTIEQLEALAKTIYDYWFVQFDFPDNDGKPYRASGGQMVYNETLKREIPAGWESVNIGDIVKIFDSQRIPLSQNERDEIPGTIPYYGATGIMGYVGKFIFNDQYVLIAEDGSVMDSKGFPIVQMVWGKSWINNHAHVLQGANGFSSELLFLTLKTIPVVNIMTGSIQKKINQDNLRTYKIAKPADDVLKLSEDVLAPLFEKIRQATDEVTALAALRDWLLPMLMNGQVTVGSNPDIDAMDCT